MAKETTTVIKKILPYLERSGYVCQDELFFEESVKSKEKVVGFTDIEVKVNGKLMFLIEAKRDTLKINDKHRQQALQYGKAKNVKFVVVTNGQSFEMWNVKSEQQIKINGDDNLIPSKRDLEYVMKAIEKKSDISDIKITSKGLSIYTPGASLNEMVNIFKRCHRSIRDIEKDDENAFSDFSKLLFLKLLEEKAQNEQNDEEGYQLPYGQRFSKIAKMDDDIIKSSIVSMFQTIQRDPKYSEVLESDVFHIQNAKTFGKIVKELAVVNFGDSDVDVKGSAFEYFLKFNLKGSQLGQYFTPREVVKLMIELSGIKSIVPGLVNKDNHYMVVDPACGSGGFLVKAMQILLKQAQKLYNDGFYDEKIYKEVSRRIKREVFYGCDAKHMLVRTAKMNMIIAGDGFTNIKHGNSLTEDISFLKISEKNRKAPYVDFVLANPPFGMSENELSSSIMELYDVNTARGQALFIQKMIRITKPGGIICTVIDEGILNTSSMVEIRKYILRTCHIEAVIRLPYVTFEPNYARVSTSVLLLKKKIDEIDKQEYPVFMYDLKEIGYAGNGKPCGRSSDEITEELVEKYKEFKNEYQ